MVKHIVMWQFAESALGKSFDENFEIARARLEALTEKIPQIKLIEVRKNILPDQKYNAVLYSEFDTAEDVEIYQNHPAHKEVAAFIAQIRTDRISADYIV